MTARCLIGLDSFRLTDKALEFIKDAKTIAP